MNLTMRLNKKEKEDLEKMKKKYHVQKNSEAMRKALAIATRVNKYTKDGELSLYDKGKEKIVVVDM